MASTSDLNNVVFEGQANTSAADALRRKHEARESHQPLVEDAIDEEDLLHPPQSLNLPVSNPTQDIPAPSQTQPLSTKAAGKQKVSSEPDGRADQGEVAGPSLNTQSHESFPQLGAAHQSSSRRPVAAAWGAKKPTSVSTITNGSTPSAASSHGVNGSNAPSSNVSSGTSTPASGLSTPNHFPSMSSPSGHLPSQRGPVQQPMSIPGKYSERITLFPQEMKPRNQLKKPVPDVLREINRKSKANVQVLSGAGGAVHFDAKGPVDAVRQALKEVAKELGSKQSTRVSIPASVRPHIIGRQGAVVQAISQRTGARIQVPRPNETSQPLDDDDDIIIDVLIEGDSVAAEMARREIENIVNERTSTVNIKLKDIPVEFYPFVAGPHSSRISAMEEGRDLRIRVPSHHTWQHPQPSTSNETSKFSIVANSPILLAGGRLAVQQARAEIERHVQALRDSITLFQMEGINRGQHQFVLGEKGVSLQDFLSETGCTVLLPPPMNDSETLMVIGPRENIEAAKNRVEDLAVSMQMQNVDLSRQHPDAPLGASTHARYLTRYLKHRREIERLEQLFDAHIALPNLANGPGTWDIYSKDGKNLIRARTEIMNIVNGHPPSRLAHVEVDPFYHTHLREKSARSFIDQYGVNLVFPEEMEGDPKVLMVYEGPAGTTSNYEVPKKQPSAAEIQQFERGLREARQHIAGLIAAQEDVIGTSLPVPKNFHDKVQRFVNREQQSLSDDEIPVTVRIGEPKAHGRHLPPSQTPIAAAALENEITLRGPADSVNALVEKITRFVAEEHEYERERDFTLSFDFPQKYANYLIGKKGENIRKYRDEYDVEIQVGDGKVEIKGPKPKAEAAKVKIIALGKKLEDEATHVLKIKPQFHRDLIGAKGSQVNRLQDRYNVRVNFPRSAPAASDDQSIIDGGSEVGGAQRHGRPAQAPDEVIIKGPRKGADEARDELLSLLQWTIDNSHTALISVAQSQVPMLIGHGGREMENMRMTTGAQIDVPDFKKENASPTGRTDIRVKGTKKQVEEAKKLLESRAKVFDDSIVKTIEVDKRHHKALIGGGGANIRNIVVQAGGSDDRRELARMVRFPRPDSEENSIRLEGNKSVVEKIAASIEAITRQREDQVTEHVEVAPEKHRLLIGRGGETRRNLDSRFNVNIEVPKQSETGQARSLVKITGLPTDVASAKGHILEMVKDQAGETVQVPRKLHHVVSDNGQFFRRLRDNHRVKVDHAGQTPPPRDSSRGEGASSDGQSMPLITDEPGIDDVSWEIRKLADGGESGDIPWVLRGSESDAAKARAVLEAALQQALEQSHAGYLTLPDPRAHRFVIGPGGSQVNTIRKQTGCKITVPRNQSKGDAIEILGSEDGVKKAKDIILELVKNGGRTDSRG
ncbi:MAG: hypothetical protein M1833_007275 [Piccolia ochrophora]|nr:MAG: hypothetical protein M1833_007275 [Piccolia ochrophora]